MLGLRPRAESRAAPQELINTRMVIFGNSGSGKSALGWAFFSSAVLAQSRKRFIVIEPEAYFYHGFGICAGLEEADFDWIELDESAIASNPEEFLDPGAWAGAIVENPRLVVTCSAMRPKVKQYLGSVIAEAITLAGDTFVLWDEVPDFLPERERGHEGIPKMVNSGRKQGIDMILISQFRTYSHPLLTKIASQSHTARNFVFAYQVRDENELKALRPIFGDRTPELRDLGALEFLVALPTGQIDRSSNPQVFEALFGYSPAPASAEDADEWSSLFEEEEEAESAPAPQAQPAPEPQPQAEAESAPTAPESGQSAPQPHTSAGEPHLKAQRPQLRNAESAPATAKAEVQPAPAPHPEERLELKRDAEGRLYADGLHGPLYVHGPNKSGRCYFKSDAEGALTELPSGQVPKRKGNVFYFGK